MRVLPQSDEELIRRCLKGQGKAQRLLYERYAAQMFSLCRRYLPAKEDAEEVLSNGFLKVFEKLGQYRGEGPLGAWIQRLMVREALNFLRYRKNYFAEQQVKDLSGKDTPKRENDTAEAEYLLWCIAQLPTGYRTVFNLYALEGYQHKEIAAMLNISESTSKSQLHKARQQLQAFLSQGGAHLKKVIK